MYFRLIRANQNILVGYCKHDGNNLLRIPSGLMSLVCHKSSRGGHEIKYKPYVPIAVQDHDHKNMKLKRPMSPHLTVYAPTLPAMTSIAQRATGSILTFYALSLACGALFLSNGVETYVSMIQSLNLGRISILFIKIVLGAPFAFHYFNGMRYVAWNTARFLQMKQVYETSKKAMMAAAIMTALFAFI